MAAALDAGVAHVRFVADFDYWPTPRHVIAYKDGHELTVRRECADQAIAAGAAQELPPPCRKARKAED